MPSFSKLITDLKSIYEIQSEAKKIEERSKIKEAQIANKYHEESNLQIQKIRRRSDLYIRFQKKKEEPLQLDKIPKFLESSWEIQKNKHISLLSQQRVYHLNFIRTDKALQAVNKEYENFVGNKRQETKILRQRIEQLTNSLQQVINNYTSLSENKIQKALTEPKIKENDKGIGLIHFLSDKIDKLFQRQMMEINYGKDELQKMKSIKNDVLGKIQYLIDLLKRKQQQKKIIDAENDQQIQFHQKKREIFLKEVAQAKQRQKQALQLLQMMKQQQKRHLSTLFSEKNKLDSYQLQVTQFRRQITRINGQIEKHRKRQDKYFEQLAKKPFDEKQKLEVLIARERDKDLFILEKKRQQKQLIKQKKFFETLRLQEQKREKILRGQLPQQQQKPYKPFQTKNIFQSYLEQQKRKDEELSAFLAETGQRVKQHKRQKQQMNSNLNQTQK